jgi:hypothetical protein
MRRRVALTMTVGLLAACLYAQKINVSYVKSTDFGNYRTWAWKPGHVLGKSQILPMELIDKYVLNAVKPVLAAKGLKEVETSPDLYVTYFISLTQKSETGPLDEFDTFGQLGYQASDVYNPAWNDAMVRNYRKGILLIDLVDARTNTLVWRAHCREATDKPGDAQTTLDRVVDKALSDYPPKAGK